MTSDSPPVIDLEHVGSLFSLLPDGGEELLAVFVADSADRIARLTDLCAAEGDPVAVREIAHALAGSAATVGATGLEAAARALMRAGPAGSIEACATRVAALSALLQETDASLRSLLHPG